MQVTDAAEWLRGIDDKGVAPLVANLLHLFDSFVEIGLGYLSLDRPSGTLSGGESQRTKMVRHLGSALTDVTYVFDEPTVGLHPHDIQRMNNLLIELRDKGNTVLVVEHKPETIAIADHVVDLGPGAGTHGGTVCFEGTVEGLKASDTLTGRHLDHRAALKDTVRTPTGTLEIRGADSHNLQDVDVDVPLGVLCVVTGVAGSGKSSLVHGSIPDGAGVVSIDQGAIHGSRRSNPATYTGLLDPIRTAFAKANDVKPALFSSNSEGACPTCNGNGMIYTELSFMETVATPCEDCGGRRFLASVLELRFGGLASRTSGSATSSSVSRSRPCPVASGSGSSSRRGWPRRAASTSSTSPRAVSISPTSSSSSGCWTASSSPASRSSSSLTTRRSWRTPIGSSTSAREPATTADGSSSREPRPISSPPDQPSPASTSRPTSGLDRCEPGSTSCAPTRSEC
jgi:ABC-type Mn2+/Zn2+ transport system ATPase subunit